MNKLSITFIFFVLSISIVQSQSSTESTTDSSMIDSSVSSGKTCESCKCYKLKCSRLDNASANCANEYRDTCDNSEDISEADSCHIQCDCCLQNKCYKSSNYKCIMFRTYEFSNIMYFIFMVVNFFILLRIRRVMFSKSIGWFPEHLDEMEGLNGKSYSPGHVTVKYLPGNVIKRDPNQIANIQDPNQRNFVDGFFNDLQKLDSVASSNSGLFTVLVVIYVIIGIFFLVSVFIFGTKPLIYVFIVWIQHILQIVFFVLAFMTYKKIGLYIPKVRNLLKDYKNEQNVDIDLHEVGNKLDFNFNG